MSSKQGFASTHLSESRGGNGPEPRFRVRDEVSCPFMPCLCEGEGLVRLCLVRFEEDLPGPRSAGQCPRSAGALGRKGDRGHAWLAYRAAPREDSGAGLGGGSRRCPTLRACKGAGIAGPLGCGFLLLSERQIDRVSHGGLRTPAGTNRRRSTSCRVV